MVLILTAHIRATCPTHSPFLIVFNEDYFLPLNPDILRTLLSRYSDCLQVEWLMNRGSIPSRDKKILFGKTTRPAPVPAYRPLSGCLVLLPRD
jgi:hypothetical protein